MNANFIYLFIYFGQKQTNCIYLISCTYRVNLLVKCTPYVQANLYHLPANDKCRLERQFYLQVENCNSIKVELSYIGWQNVLSTMDFYFIYFIFIFFAESQRWTFKSIPIKTCYCYEKTSM